MGIYVLNKCGQQIDYVNISLKSFPPILHG